MRVAHVNLTPRKLAISPCLFSFFLFPPLSFSPLFLSFFKNLSRFLFLLFLYFSLSLSLFLCFSRSLFLIFLLSFSPTLSLLISLILSFFSLLLSPSFFSRSLSLFRLSHSFSSFSLSHSLTIFLSLSLSLLFFGPDRSTVIITGGSGRAERGRTTREKGPESVTNQQAPLYATPRSPKLGQTEPCSQHTCLSSPLPPPPSSPDRGPCQGRTVLHPLGLLDRR